MIVWAFIKNFFLKFKVYIIVFGIVTAALIKVAFSIKKAGKAEGKLEEQKDHFAEKEAILTDSVDKLVGEINKRKETISGAKHVKDDINAIPNSDIVDELQERWSRESRNSRSDKDDSGNN